MSSYDNILNTMKFSYSNVNSFQTCPHGWFLTYIQRAERQQNFYSEYGAFCHDILQKFFDNELEIYEMLPYYKEQYSNNIKSPDPIVFGKNLAPQYYQQGCDFFANFSFDKNLYDIVETESFTLAEVNGILITIKPDMLLKRKDSGKLILLDYKSSNPYDKKGNLIQSKILDYKKQLNLYANVLWIKKNIVIDEMWLWFFRSQKIEKFSVDPVKISEDMEWFFNLVNNIKNEEDFLPNTNNKFFCNSLCGVSKDCFFKDLNE